MPELSGLPWNWILGLGGTVLGIFVLYFLINAMLYRKVGPNEVLIISGWGGEIAEDPTTGERRKLGYRIVRGGGRMVLPVLQRADVMSLELMTLDVESSEFYTKQGVPIEVDGVAQIKVRGEDVSIRTAAEQFLSKRIEDVRFIAHQTVSGHLRAILSTMSVEEIYAEHERFAQNVQDVAARDLAHMGMEVISFTIRAIRDRQGYLEALGKPRIAAVKRDAQIAEAEAQRDAAIRSAVARQEAEQARFVAETKIAEADRDYQVNQQEYQRSINQERAEADLAYDLQKFRTEQEVKEQEVQVDIVAKQKQIELEQAEIKRRELELTATVQKPADAERTRIQTLADAEQYRLRTTADGQAQATKLSGEAEADANRARGIAQADIVKAQGVAEAEAIRAKGIAQADAMQQQAAAFRQYNEAAVASMFVEKLPDIAEAIASPLTRVDKIVLVGNGSEGAGASRITGEVTSMMAQVPPVLEAMTGINLGELIKKSPKLGEGGAKGEKQKPQSQ
jgi:flotillin